MIRILGNHVLVRRLKKPEAVGFETVDAMDDFVNRGEVVQLGEMLSVGATPPVKEGDVVVFAKFSPDTQELDVDGEKMKAVLLSDIIGVEA